jgi:hypothetical protein
MTPEGRRQAEPVAWSAAPTTPVIVANEFAEVLVRRVPTRNGVRLEVFAPRLGRRILLDALELEALTWQTPALFSDLLEEPFGPTDPTGGRLPEDDEEGGWVA